MLGRHVARAFLGCVLAAAPLSAAPPVEWDGLQRVASKQFALVYLQPGADFRGYSKVIIEPTEVAFHKNWRTDYNATTRGVSNRVSDRDVENAISKSVATANDIFANAWRKGGYEIAAAPAPDVLKVKTAILNISVSAPEVASSARSYVFAREAGRAALLVELRDSVTGALIGRVVDQKVAGDNTVGWRTSVSNRADFRELVETWAKDSVRGMSELKRISSAR
jgi:hypothetical protein